jgi:hypothetical protein
MTHARGFHLSGYLLSDGPSRMSARPSATSNTVPQVGQTYTPSVPGKTFLLSVGHRHVCRPGSRLPGGRYAGELIFLSS